MNNEGKSIKCGVECKYKSERVFSLRVVRVTTSIESLKRLQAFACATQTLLCKIRLQNTLQHQPLLYKAV